MKCNLTASLHTVTAVTNVAMMLECRHTETGEGKLPSLTVNALRVLGYEPEQYADAKGDALFAACLVSVRRALGGAK